MKPSDWTAYTQLIQELIGGAVRRNTFSRLELDLLLDMQMATIRKSSRPEMLRRYLRHVQRQLLTGASAPQSLARFIEAESRPRALESAVVLDGLRRAS